MNPNQNNPVQPGQPGQSPQHPLVNYHFSAEELRVLKQCNIDSFYQRSLPIGTGLGFAAWYAVRNGYLKPSLKYGAIPKVTVGVVIGYFIGKFSYQSTCASKIMQLPNSKLAELLRQRKKGGIYESLTTDKGFGTGLSLPPFNSQSETYSDEVYKQENALNLDTERPDSRELDDVYRPNLDGPITKFEDNLPDPPKHIQTYDELRQKNRAEYQKRFQGPSPPAQNAPAQQPPPNSQDRTTREQPDSGANPQQKNKYGDVWT